MNLKTLKRLLQIRKNEEYQEVQKYSKEQAIVDQEAKLLNHLVSTRSQAFSELGAKKNQVYPLGHGLAEVSNTFILLRERQISSQSKRLESAKSTAEKAFQVLREKVQQRKMIEKLIEKEQARIKTELQKKRQKAQDEFSQQIRRMES